MRVCLDTSAYSRLCHGGSESLRSLLEEAEWVLMPSIVLGELAAGFEMGSRRELNYEGIDAFLDVAGTYLIPVDRDIAERYGALVKGLKEAGTPIPTNDIWIAATALEQGARLVTYDTHFEAIPGLLVLSP